MNHILVLYRSKTGYTRRYAEWIGEDLNCDVLEMKRVKVEQLKEYDTIIFGGYVHAGSIVGANYIMKHWKALKDKNIFMFTVGIREGNVHKVEQLWKRQFTTEQLDRMKMFYLRGGFDLKKLGMWDILLIKLFKFILSSQKEPFPETKDIMEMFDVPVDFAKKENLEIMMKSIKRVCEIG